MLYSTGRRKTSSARVFMKEGNGNIIINKIDFKKYFFFIIMQKIILQPFFVIDNFLNKFDFYITVKGGGIYGQAVAVRHGISRVILKYDLSLRSKLKICGFLTRDSRSVERKKYGFRKSRCRPQYSKR